MTTPAQDAPLVFPSVAFRPKRLLIVCVALTAVAVTASAFTGHVLFGLAIFQAVLVMSTSIPVMKKIRSSGLDVAETPASESKD